ncbi:MAG TPA: hypothetical protein VHC20_05955 [Candidatus Paceibacterota bacterium]|nr:hypothetical protein [Candidatus Paceibacterota bacterium]
MAKGKKAVEIPPERLEEIRADARAGTNWAAEMGYGPACRCGLKRNGLSADDGTCPRHPEKVAPQP